MAFVATNRLTVQGFTEFVEFGDLSAMDEAAWDKVSVRCLTLPAQPTRGVLVGVRHQEEADEARIAKVLGRERQRQPSSLPCETDRKSVV